MTQCEERDFGKVPDCRPSLRVRCKQTEAGHRDKLEGHTSRKQSLPHDKQQFHQKSALDPNALIQLTACALFIPMHSCIKA